MKEVPLNCSLKTTIAIMSIKHVFFDLDHTLWDFEKNSTLCFETIFKKNKIKVNLNDFLEIYKPINFSYWKLYRENKISKENLRFKRFKDVFDILNYEITDEVIDVLSDDFINNLTNSNYLISGTLDVLEYLKDKYKLHIITNGFKEVQDVKLIKSGIKKYFNTVTTSESVGVKKPMPQIFSYALSIAKANKAESIMIGDDFEADVEGALNFGMKAIHLEDFSNKIKNNKGIKVNSLTELKQYL